MPGDRAVESRRAADHARLCAGERVEDGDLELARRRHRHLAFHRGCGGAMAAAGISDEKEQLAHPLTATDAATSGRAAKSVMTWVLVPSAFSTYAWTMPFRSALR